MDGFKFISLLCRIITFPLVELPLKFILRSLSICLFALDALIIIPCMIADSLFMYRDTPFGRLVDFIGEMSEKLDAISYFRIEARFR